MGVAGTGVAARHGRRAVAPRWEQAQIASNRRLHDVFLGSPVPQSTASPSGQLLDVNDSLCRLLGYTRAELLQQTVQSITDPGDVAANAAKLEELLQGLTSHFVLEKRYLRKDGTQVLALATCSLIRDAAGRPAYIAAVVQDLTERQQAKDHLRASEDLFRRVHLDAEQFFVATGAHMPDGPWLARYRAAAAGPAGEDLARRVEKMRKAGLNVGGNELKTAPRDYPADHPRIELLRWREAGTEPAGNRKRRTGA